MGERSGAGTWFMARVALVLWICVFYSVCDGHDPGTRLGTCYPNDTCSSGLECRSGVCVDKPVTTGDGLSADAGIVSCP